jgi:prepilin signal peptidase PulO-like enzyme (type II secretory pathway)
MQRSKVLFALGALIMTAVIVYGFIAGDLIGEAMALFPYPWFQISMVDLYTGLFLFSGWIAFRERSRKTTAIWIVMLILLGNLATCIYALVAAIQSRGDWRTFWLGHHSTEGKDVTSQ